MDAKGRERGILKLEPRPRVVIDTSKAELTPQGSYEHPPVSPQPSVDRLSVTWAEPGSMSSSGVNLFHLPSETPINNEVKFSPNAGDGSDDEDYSASLSAVLRQRRASVRRSRKGRARRPSSPFLGDENRSRRRSSVFTTSSGDTAISMEDAQSAVVSQEQIFENIHLHKEVLGSVKQQPLGMRRKLKIVHQAKGYIKRHEGQLQERLAQSKSTRDIYARFNILMATKWHQLKREAANTSNLLIPWELRIKEIESHFGSVVASYFTFLRWLFWVNLVIGFILLVFVIVPECLTANPHEDGERKIIMDDEKANASNLLTLWEFEGLLKYSPIFYGYYSNIERPQYRIPLAYFLTGLAVYIFSFVAILRKMAENSRMSKLSEKEDECIFSWKLFTGWDFMIGNTETAHNRIASVILGFKEALLEEAEKKKDLRNWRIISLRAIVNICVVILLVISAYAVVTVVSRSDEGTKPRGWWRENETTVVVTLISISFPVLFELLGFLEHYHPRKQLRLQLARIMLLNLLNLYSLIFALLSKIDDMSKELDSLKPTFNESIHNETYLNDLLMSNVPQACYEERISCDLYCLPSLSDNSTFATTTVSPFAPPPTHAGSLNKLSTNVLSRRQRKDTSFKRYDESTTEEVTTLSLIDLQFKRLREIMKNLNTSILVANETAAESNDYDYTFDNFENETDATSELYIDTTRELRSTTNTATSDSTTVTNIYSSSTEFLNSVHNTDSVSTTDPPETYDFTTVKYIDNTDKSTTYITDINSVETTEIQIPIITGISTSDIFETRTFDTTDISSSDATERYTSDTTEINNADTTEINTAAVVNYGGIVNEKSKEITNMKSSSPATAESTTQITDYSYKPSTEITTIIKATTSTVQNKPVSAKDAIFLCPNITFNYTVTCGKHNVTQVYVLFNCTVKEKSCFVRTCNFNLDEIKNNHTHKMDFHFRDSSNRSVYNLTITTRKKLLQLCWETMFGQELVKLTMMDLVFVLLGTLFMDFFRALFVRYMNRCWCWDLEKKFPEYGDFKIAENILHLINNQGMVWMGMFFSPGLVILNVFKLMIMMYLRSWAVMTCNVPHEVVFRVSKSNNFYLALLLTMLFLCVLPVGYTIVCVKPSWHCGPFSEHDKIYYILTNYIFKLLPHSLNFTLQYIASPAIVIPLLVLLILIIYYLTSLTNSLREANNDLKIQLRRERTEERRKMFQLADTRRRGGSSAMDNTPFARWKKALPSLPMSKSIDSDDRKTLTGEETSEPLKISRKRGGGIFAKIVGLALDKKTDVEVLSEVEIASPSPNNIDDETDTDFHENLPKEVLKIKDITITKPDTKKRSSVEFKTDDNKKKDNGKSHKLKLVKVDDRSEKDAVTEKQIRDAKVSGKSKDTSGIRKTRSDERKLSEKQTSQTSTQSRQSDSIGSVIPVITISTTESDEEVLSKKNKGEKVNETLDKIKSRGKRTPDLKSLQRQSSVESLSDHKPPNENKKDEGHKYQYSL